MAAHAGPDAVESGLVLHLDAANSKSYPGSGTTWTDISASGNVGTLINGAAFSSVNMGAIVFDGSNDRVSFSSNTNYNVGTGNFSVSCWMKSSYKANYQTTVSLDNNATGNGILLYTGLNNGVLRTWIGGSVRNGTVDICNNVWNFVCVTRSYGTVTHYINAVSDGTYVASGSVSANQSLQLGFNSTSGYPYSGSISHVSFYNRALSAAEIKQNFNALRGRYGI